MKVGENMVDRLSWQAATAAQENVWFAQQLRPDDVALYNCAAYLDMPGRVSPSPTADWCGPWCPMCPPHLR